MDIYNLTKVDSTIDGVIGPLLYGFNIIGVQGRPLVVASFSTNFVWAERALITSAHT